MTREYIFLFNQLPSHQITKLFKRGKFFSCQLNYCRKINPVENISVSIVAMGEGWHNYHHVFPWDYKAAELAHRVNITTFWIQFFAKLGWAYDLKEPTPELVRRTIERCGKSFSKLMPCLFDSKFSI